MTYGRSRSRDSPWVEWVTQPRHPQAQRDRMGHPPFDLHTPRNASGGKTATDIERPEKDGTTIGFWIKLAIEGRSLPICGSGKQMRVRTDIDDIVKTFLLA